MSSLIQIYQEIGPKILIEIIDEGWVMDIEDFRRNDHVFEISFPSFAIVAYEFLSYDYVIYKYVIYSRLVKHMLWTKTGWTFEYDGVDYFK